MGISIQQANSMSYFSNTNQVLQKSSSYNASVVSLQNDLTTIGYNTYGVDGYFGDNTKNAVVAFQNSYGLDADGIAGAKTLGKINELINGAKNAKVAISTPAYDSISISGNLQSGNKGNSVKALQTNLIRMGYNCGGYGADGEFGTGTYNSVKQFQRDYGLTQDGIVGTQTSQAIANALKTGNNGVPNYIMGKPNASTPSVSTSNTATLQSGNKGDAVKTLQTNLIKMGYNCGGYGVDGYFGTGTYNSVRDFQRDHGLIQDGIVGNQTNQAIANALKTGNNGVPNYIMGSISASSTGSSTPSVGIGYSQVNLSKVMLNLFVTSLPHYYKHLP